MTLTKLDNYNYIILKVDNTLRIGITLDANNDPISTDILSEIESSKGKIYVEGRFFIYKGFKLKPCQLILEVEEINYEQGI